MKFKLHQIIFMNIYGVLLATYWVCRYGFYEADKMADRLLKEHNEKLAELQAKIQKRMWCKRILN